MTDHKATRTARWLQTAPGLRFVLAIAISCVFFAAGTAAAAPTDADPRTAKAVSRGLDAAVAPSPTSDIGARPAVQEAMQAEGLKKAA